MFRWMGGRGTLDGASVRAGSELLLQLLENGTVVHLDHP